MKLIRLIIFLVVIFSSNLIWGEMNYVAEVARLGMSGEFDKAQDIIQQWEKEKPEQKKDINRYKDMVAKWKQDAANEQYKQKIEDLISADSYDQAAVVLSEWQVHGDKETIAFYQDWINKISNEKDIEKREELKVQFMTFQLNDMATNLQDINEKVEDVSQKINDTAHETENSAESILQSLNKEGSQ